MKIKNIFLVGLPILNVFLWGALGALGMDKTWGNDEIKGERTSSFRNNFLTVSFHKNDEPSVQQENAKKAPLVMVKNSSLGKELSDLLMGEDGTHLGISLESSQNRGFLYMISNDSDKIVSEMYSTSGRSYITRYQDESKTIRLDVTKSSSINSTIRQSSLVIKAVLLDSYKAEPGGETLYWDGSAFRTKSSQNTNVMMNMQCFLRADHVGGYLAHLSKGELSRQTFNHIYDPKTSDKKEDVAYISLNLLTFKDPNLLKQVDSTRGYEGVSNLFM